MRALIVSPRSAVRPASSSTAASSDSSRDGLLGLTERRAERGDRGRGATPPEEPRHGPANRRPSPPRRRTRSHRAAPARRGRPPARKPHARPKRRRVGRGHTRRRRPNTHRRPSRGGAGAEDKQRRRGRERAPSKGDEGRPDANPRPQEHSRTKPDAASRTGGGDTRASSRAPPANDGRRQSARHPPKPSPRKDDPGRRSQRHADPGSPPQPRNEQNDPHAGSPVTRRARARHTIYDELAALSRAQTEVARLTRAAATLGGTPTASENAAANQARDDGTTQASSEETHSKNPARRRTRRRATTESGRRASSRSRRTFRPCRHHLSELLRLSAVLSQPVELVRDGVGRLLFLWLHDMDFILGLDISEDRHRDCDVAVEVSVKESLSQISVAIDMRMRGYEHP